jgi:nucleolar protein 56
MICLPFLIGLLVGTCSHVVHPVQAIALLDTLDKDINTFIMRVREWYGWHFPELAKIVNDNFQYARIVMLVQDKATLSVDHLSDLTEVVGEEEVAEQVQTSLQGNIGCPVQVSH